MANFGTTEQSVVYANLGLSAQALSATSFTTASTTASNTGARGYANSLVSSAQAALSDNAFSAAVMANLGLTSAVIGTAAYDALLAGLAGYVNSVGVANRGVVVAQLASAVAALTSDATFGAAATNLNNAASSAFAYSTNAANTTAQAINVATAVAPVTTFTLTTSADYPALTSGNDVINATSTTLTAGDVVVDSSSTDNDTLNISSTGNAGNATATVVGIENVNFNVTAFAVPTITATAIQGGNITVNQLQLAASGDATVDGVNSVTVTAGTGITGTLALTTVAAASNVKVAAGDAAAVSVATVTTGSATVTGGSKLATVTVEGATATVTTSAAAATVNTKGTAATTDKITINAGAAVTIANNATAVESITVSGNGAATVATVNTTAATAYASAGTQAVTFKGTKAMFSGVAITDGNGAAATVLEITDALVTADYSKAAVDKIVLDTTNAGVTTLTLANNATLELTATQATNAITLQQVAANKAISTDVVNILSTDSATVTITSDSTTSASEVAFNTVNFNSGTKTAVTGLVATLGTGVLNIAGSKNVTVDATSTASKIDATNLSGVLTATADTATVKSITGGSGADALTVAANATGITVNGGSGADTVTVGDAGVATIDGGAGNDTVSITTGAAGLTLTNVEILTLAADVTAAKFSLLDGKSYVMTGANNFAFGTTATNLDSATLDLSKLAISDVIDFTVDASGGLDPAKFTSTQGVTITGASVANSITGSGNADVIAGGAAADTLLGGAGADTITGGNGADTITGGTGSDTIILTETTAARDVVVSTVGAAYTTAAADKITGFTFGASKDIFKVDISDSTDEANVGVVTAGNGATAIAGDLVVKEVVVGTGATLAATDELVVMTGGTFADAAALIAAITSDGSVSTSDIAWSTAPTATNAFLLFYSDGTNGHLVTVADAKVAANATLEAADVSVIEIATFMGVTSVTAGMIDTTNFTAVA